MTSLKRREYVLGGRQRQATRLSRCLRLGGFADCLHATHGERCSDYGFKSSLTLCEPAICLQPPLGFFRARVFPGPDCLRLRRSAQAASVGSALGARRDGGRPPGRSVSPAGSSSPGRPTDGRTILSAVEAPSRSANRCRQADSPANARPRPASCPAAMGGASDMGCTDGAACAGAGQSDCLSGARRFGGELSAGGG